MALSFAGIPPGAWNCHMHCFDPDRHPLKANRSYTPEPAPLSSLAESSFTENVVIVEATIENGPQGVIDHLKDFDRNYSSRQALGIVAWDPTAERSLANLTECELKAFNDAGVRSVRIHGSYGGSGEDPEWVWGQFRQVAQLPPMQKYGWGISSQLPISTWSALKERILHDEELAGITIVADHNGSAQPKDYGTDDFDNFLDLLASGRLSVKVGALHRRSPGKPELMRPIITSFAQRAPHGIVWGSDWPHVNTTGGTLDPKPPLQGTDTEGELALLKEWLTEEQWIDMFTSNPERIFRP